MRVSNLARRTVVSCTIHNNLEHAAQLMWEHDIGCLPVIDDQGHIAGMITDRDACMAAYTQGLPLHAIPVTTAMARQVFTCTEIDDVATVERMMSKHQIRRMPVVDYRGHLIGMVALNDIARAASAGELSPAEVTSTLASVGVPRAVIASAA